jgi:hypothetical protein
MTRISPALLIYLLVAGPVSAFGCVVGQGTSDTCTEMALDACLPAGGTFDGAVTFDCGDTATITVTTQKIVSADTTIDGGAVITISGGRRVGVFSVSGGVTLTLENLAVNDGSSSGGAGVSIADGGTVTATNAVFANHSTANEGGAILNSHGTLTVTNSVFEFNNAGLGGGAIANLGNAEVIDSTFNQNTSLGLTVNDQPFGGAIWNSGGTLTVTGSTFFRNTAGGPYRTFGGAIGNDGTLTIANSTFFGNKATGIYGAGGAIFNGAASLVSSTGTAVVTNSTFVQNFAPEGAAIFDDAGFGGTPRGTVTLANTIIASSASGSNCRLGNNGGTIADAGHNIDDDGTCRLSGTSLTGIDPVLDPAGPSDNGGPTQTIALLDGSPAIGAGDPSVCAAPPVGGIDQRGFPRPGAGEIGCSIGAYEFSVTTTTSTTSTTEPAVASDVDGTYCVRESWTLTVTGSRSLSRSGVATGTIQVVGGVFQRTYHHAAPLPAKPLSGRLGFDGSSYYVDDAPALGPLTEYIPTRKFYAIINLSFAQILVPLNFGIPCRLAEVGCLEKGDNGSSASGTSLADLEASGMSFVDKPTSDFSLEFDITSVAQLTPGAGCGESDVDVCDDNCQAALASAADNLEAAFAAAAGTKTAARLTAVAHTVTRALTRAERAHGKRQLKAFHKVRVKLAMLRKATARATGNLSATTVAALEAAIDALVAILPS